MIGVSTCSLHFINRIKEVETQRKSLFCDVFSRPDFELKIRVFLLVQLQNLTLSLRHFALNPNEVKNLRYELRLIPFRVGLVLESGVEDRKLLHGNAVLYQVIHVVSHRIGLCFVIVELEFIQVDYVPLACGDNDVVGQYYTSGHVEDVRVLFDEPLDSLPMRNLGVVVQLRQVLDHIQKVLQKVEAVVEIDSQVCAETELRDYFVAV